MALCSTAGCEDRRPAPSSEGPATPIRVDLPRLRMQAVDLLQQALLRADETRDLERRRRLLSQLKEGCDDGLWTVFVPYLKDEDAAARLAAIEALGRTGGEKGARMLREIGDSTTDIHLYTEIAVVLSRAGQVRGVEMLREVMRSKDDRARLRATVILAQQGDRKAQKSIKAELAGRSVPADPEILAGLLSSGVEEVAQQVRAALAARLEDATIPEEERLEVAALLARVEDERARRVLVGAADGSGPHKLLAAKKLVALGERTWCTRFRSLADDANQLPAVRAQAMEGLGLCGEESGVLPLSRVLPKGAAPDALRLAAAGAILPIACAQIAKAGFPPQTSFP